MNIVFNIVIFLGIIVIFLPKIFFIVMFLPIRYIENRRRVQSFSKLDARLQNVNNLTDKSPSQKKQIINFIAKYIHGYTRYFIIRVGFIPSHSIRNYIYRYILLANIDKNTVIYYGAEIRDAFKLKIGKSIIGDKAILDARNGIIIGDNVNFSSNVSIWTEQHDHRSTDFACNSGEHFKVIIKDRAWIGPNSTILHGVTIGQGAVVAAGSVVTKDVPDFTIVAGIPAKQIGMRTTNLSYTFKGNYQPFY